MQNRTNEVIAETIMELAFLKEEPQLNQLLKEDLGIDSLKKVELIVSLEEKLNISLNIEDLDPVLLNSVADIYRLFEKYC